MPDFGSRGRFDVTVDLCPFGGSRFLDYLGVRPFNSRRASDVTFKPWDDAVHVGSIRRFARIWRNPQWLFWTFQTSRLVLGDLRFIGRRSRANDTTVLTIGFPRGGHCGQCMVFHGKEGFSFKIGNREQFGLLDIVVGKHVAANHRAGSFIVEGEALAANGEDDSFLPDFNADAMGCQKVASFIGEFAERLPGFPHFGGSASIDHFAVLRIVKELCQALTDAVAPLFHRKEMVAGVFGSAMAPANDVLDALHFFDTLIETHEAHFATLAILKDAEQAFNCFCARVVAWRT